MSQFIEMFGGDKWIKKCLGEVGTFKRGGGFQKSDYVEHGIPCIHYGQIHTKFGPFISSHITEISLDLEVKTKFASKGDLIIAITSEDAEGSCKSTAWLGDYPVAVGGHAAIFNHSMNPLYMTYFFKFAMFNHAKMEYVHGTKVVEMRPDDIAKISIPYPPMSLQEQFSAIAQQADKSGFDGRKSQFIEMFKCSAERVALSSLCDTFIDGDWIEAKDQSDSGIRLIQTGNVGVGTFKDKGDKARYISEDTFNRLNCTEVVEGDILISRLPDPVGRACIIPAGLGKSITAVDCTIIRLNDKVLPKFFVAFTSTPDYAMQIKKVLSGTTRLRVSRANLGKIQVPLPSVDKQQQFVTIAEQADKSGFELRKSIEAIDQVIKSLINS